MKAILGKCKYHQLKNSCTIQYTTLIYIAKMSKDDGNLFEEVLKDAKGVEERLLGPSYPYWKNIKMPSQIGMSSEGSLKALGKDVNGLVEYVELLVTGDSKASKTGKPLGNKFFLKTGGKCIASDEAEDTENPDNNKKDRYIYVDNVPAGNIPFISAGMGANFSEFKGLIPGMVSDLEVFNPFTIMQAFMIGSEPSCTKLKMKTIDAHNNTSKETQYVADVDISNMDPCTFPNKKNPITKKKCVEAFWSQHAKSTSLFDDPIIQIYFISLCVFGGYLLYLSQFVKKR